MVEAKGGMKQVIRSNLLKRAGKLNLTQMEIARRINVPRQTVWHYFAGINAPNVEMLFRLSKVLGCTMDDLLEGYNGDNT